MLAAGVPWGIAAEYSMGEASSIRSREYDVECNDSANKGAREVSYSVMYLDVLTDSNQYTPFVYVVAMSSDPWFFEDVVVLVWEFGFEGSVRFCLRYYKGMWSMCSDHCVYVRNFYVVN